MKILVIDRDGLNSQLVASKAQELDHSVIEEAVKDNAIDMVGQYSVKAVFMDPSPLTSARPVVLGMRRAVEGYIYVCIMSETITPSEALRMGANDVLAKPLNPEQLAEKIANAQNMVTLVNRIGDDSEDFPSAGGVIAKSAFNQLFLSAIDRADRYSEKSCAVFISMDNYDEIRRGDGSYAAEYAVSKMAQYLVRLRRQSDIIAQTAPHEYALLLQRPQQNDEPQEAVNRFAASLAECDDIVNGLTMPARISVSLVELPSCREVCKRQVVHTPPEPAEAS